MKNQLAKVQRKPVRPAKKPPERIGRVVVATAVLEHPKSRSFLCETLFARFCPFAVSVSPKGTLRAFTGFCDDFEPIHEGAPVPQYAMSVRENEKGVKVVSFSKVANEPETGGGK